MPAVRLLPVVATAAFVAGFAVAEVTGVRPLGGLVLLAGGIWCARVAAPVAGLAATAGLLIAALALFAVSHPLGEAIGSWPAVLVTGALAGLAAAAILRAESFGRASRLRRSSSAEPQSSRRFRRA